MSLFCLNRVKPSQAEYSIFSKKQEVLIKQAGVRKHVGVPIVAQLEFLATITTTSELWIR